MRRLLLVVLVVCGLMTGCAHYIGPGSSTFPWADYNPANWGRQDMVEQ